MSMQRRSDQGGPRRDDELAQETRGLVHGTHESRAQEWREQEPAGEDQPEADWAPGTELVGEPPPGMSPRDVALRSELARHLDPSRFPADRAELTRQLLDNGAPARLIGLLDALPADRRYQNVQELSAALGLGTERHRF